jgi:hypothetical protein
MKKQPKCYNCSKEQNPIGIIEGVIVGKRWYCHACVYAIAIEVILAELEQ